MIGLGDMRCVSLRGTFGIVPFTKAERKYCCPKRSRPFPAVFLGFCGNQVVNDRHRNDDGIADEAEQIGKLGEYQQAE